MIDNQKFDSISKNIRDIANKTADSSALGDFLNNASGLLTVRVNGQYTFQIPASVLTDYIQAKKDSIDAELATLEADVVAEIPVLAKVDLQEVTVIT